MNRETRMGRLAGVLTLTLALSEAAAQYALDASPSVHGTRNPHRAAPVVGREIYSVNRATGTMVYNRANAFNDSTYSIYQRSAFSLYDSPATSGVSTAAALEQSQPRRSAPPTRTTYTTRPAARGTTATGQVAVSRVNQFVTPVARGPVTPSPARAPARPVPAMANRAYSLADRPLRSPGAESSRVRTYSVFGE